ncbi:MAG: response regulator [Candidatus Omnitrophota bacterium]
MSKRILVIDDEMNIVKMVQSRLKASGYDVITAIDGKDGIAKAKQEKPDLIILDIMMPQMDGYEALGKLKESEETKFIPVIMFTAKAESDSVSQALDLGAVDYIVKPFTPVSLLEKVAKALLTS